MNETEPHVRVVMVREDLENILEYPVPAGYAVRWYQPGDEQLWLNIHLAADKYHPITPELFAREFGEARDLLKDRQCFVFDANEKPVGTATAWFNDNFNGAAYGRVNWVAVVPQHQQRGLGKTLMTLICRRLRELGHRRAYLTTSTAQTPAIRLYHRFGFVPLIRSAQDTAI
ncbi:MAG: GNAT family N-acetyltransferase [Verrucomicrobia bacterium]|nr:MAG: GNAT family N-acetyltransferase [Verrucomicrobiota bacterium]